MEDCTNHTTNDCPSAGDHRYDTLYFYLSEDEPDRESLNVYESLECKFLGVPFEFNIIGSSHYIRSEAYGFHELASCEKDAAGSSSDIISLALSDEEHTRSYPYAGSLSRQTQLHSHDINCRVVVKDYPLSEFDATANYDVSYKFEENAYTAISIGESQYETWHTYPEFDLALYTRTEFTRTQ